MLNHVYTHEGMSHFGGGTCHNVKWFASTYSCIYRTFLHFRLFLYSRSCYVLIKAIKSNLLCSFRSKSRSIDFPLIFLSIIYSNLFKIHSSSIIPGTTCCAIVPISMGAPTVLCSNAIRSFHEYLLISCCFLVFA